MRHFLTPGLLIVLVLLFRPVAAEQATVRIDAARRSPCPISKYLTGKFCEHLGANIYQGMDAQVLRNPTLADWPFWNGQMTPDGVTAFHGEPDKIAAQLRQQARRLGWPDGEIDRMVEAREDGLACWWLREGPRPAIEVSPDTGPHGGRAQRIETTAGGLGIAQWTWLPLHRVRKYEVEVLVRSPEVRSLAVGLVPVGAAEPCAKTVLPGLGDGWGTLRGTLEIPARAPAEAIYRFTLTAEQPGQVVVARVTLRPADHVGGADADVVRLLRESRLPLLRWPGGNFVSGYHWEDGIGPADARPARPNYAWGGVEPNLFGTDEFLAFCRAIGCEPMICINAGDGTPEEAARWVEYCNGPADSRMGRRRAANGHPEPYRVRHWEVGNELWGRWQYHWTTAAGYTDRYRRFAAAMHAADPAIRLSACGAPVLWGKAWNDTLLRRAGPLFSTITDHPLIGGQVPATTDPLDVYRDFMAVPDVLQARWTALRSDLQAAGVHEPRLAVTELQMFARVEPAGANTAARLHRENLVSPGTQAEALYDVLIYHRAVQLAPFVEMVTHSATVNHGGGLRKERERVFANPCHYAQAMFADMAGATPVAAEATSPREKSPLVLPELKGRTKALDTLALDALAALAPDRSLLVSLVHRGTGGPLRTAVSISGFKPGPRAEIRTLSAETPWAANTLNAPARIRPVDSSVEVRDGKLELEIPPLAILRVRLPRR